MFSFRSTAPDTLPSRISVRTSPEQRVIFQPGPDGWERGGRADRLAAAEPVRIEGAIDNSLYEALDAQVPDDQLDGADRQRLAWDLADVYAWQVDFTRDIQPGDRFQVVFERLVSEDGEIRFGRVLASDLTMSGKSLTAFRFEAGGQPALLRRRRQLAPAGVPPGAGAVPPHLLHLRRAPGSIRSSGSPAATRAPTTPPRPARR